VAPREGGARRALGAAGEEAAARALRREGWTLLDRNARVRAGEIDLVVERRGVLGFVEVKARRSRAAGTPEEAVDGRKAARVAAAAEEYLARRGLSAAPRALLVAAVDMDAEGRPVEVRIVPLEE
jgi:putative endonuclease